MLNDPGSGADCRDAVDRFRDIVPVVLAGLLCGVLLSSCRVTAKSVSPSRESDGEELYGRYCAVCHDEDGRAQSAIARRLWPRPRSFTRGLFQIVSTDNGVPTRDDLVAVLERGMPGSAMPSYGWMEQDELEALAGHVLRLAVDGMTDDVVQEMAWWEGLEITPEKARETAESRLKPGAPIAVGKPPEWNDVHKNMGRLLYLQNCAACHGSDGTGREVQPLWNRDHELWARDFTTGILKGGGRHEDLVRRIVAGMPGTAMPPTRLDDDLSAAVLARHVQSLLRPGAEDRLVQQRRQLVAHRLNGDLPVTADDPAWAGVAEQRLVLAPLHWDESSVQSAMIAAVHDGEEIAIRLRWDDPTRDDRMVGGSRFPDAAAIQFSAESRPPLFGMGSGAIPVNIWHWKAYHPEDVSGFMELADVGRHHAVPTGAEKGAAGVHGGIPAPESTGGSVTATGAGSARMFAASSVQIDVSSSWADDGWSLVFQRALPPRATHEVELSPGSKLQIACAIWNGAAGDRGSRKAISIWHELVIEE